MSTAGAPPSTGSIAAERILEKSVDFPPEAEHGTCERASVDHPILLIVGRSAGGAAWHGLMATSVPTLACPLKPCFELDSHPEMIKVRQKE